MGNAGAQGCYLGSNFEFWLMSSMRLGAWVLSFTQVGSDCTSSCSMASRYWEMCSVGQLHADMKG